MLVYKVLLLFLTFVAIELPSANADFNQFYAPENTKSAAPTAPKTAMYVERKETANIPWTKKRLFDVMRIVIYLMKEKLKETFYYKLGNTDFNKFAKYVWDNDMLPESRTGLISYRAGGRELKIQDESVGARQPPVQIASRMRKTFNLPKQATAKQISDASRRYTADKALNGDKDPRYYKVMKHACAITTARVKNPWWEVDFGETLTVREVWLYNCGGKTELWRKLTNLEITVDDKLCNKVKGPASRGTVNRPSAIVTCETPLTGRKLRITKRGRRLCLCEVEWF